MLRPDYYEYFPRFSPTELAERLERMPFHQATLLTEWNIRLARRQSRQARQEFRRLLTLPQVAQRRMLVDVLAVVGLSGPIQTAISKIDRVSYVPLRFSSWAYLNVHIPLTAGTCLSPPGLVAIMLERLALGPGMRLIEFGVGSGYHLACAAALIRPGGQVAGMDLGIFPSRRRHRARFVLADMNTPPLGEGVVDAVYATCCLPGAADTMGSVVRPGGIIQVVEPLREAEFLCEPGHSPLRTRNPTYAHYLAGHPQSHACIREYTRSDHGVVRELGTLYDVAFVGARQPVAVPDNIRTPILHWGRESG